MKVPGVNGGIKPYRGKWTKDQVRHLVKRTMFGASQEDVNYFCRKSSSHAIDELISQSEELPQPPVNNYNDDKFTDDEIPLGQTWVTSAKNNGMNIGRRKNSWKSWWIGLMLNQNRTVKEKMVLFWHNHFSTESNNVDNATWSYLHNTLLRKHALGNFKEMVRTVTLDPNMLKYLNGNNNVKKAPDENYGRELQELFTVGKDNGSPYTEADVKAAARILTGFRIENNYLPDAHAVFEPNRHDTTSKYFSEFYKNTLINGREGKDGELELDEMLDMIFAREEVSLFICRKLYRFFVYHHIDDLTEQNIIHPLAETFRKNNYEIKPVLKELLGSRHFFDQVNRGAIIKSPIDFCVGLCREFDLVFPDAADYIDQYAFWNNIQTAASQMQQNIGDPPNVAGWPAYYQAPQYDKIWINSDTLSKRNYFSDRMINYGFARPAPNVKKLVIDPVAFTRSFSDPGDPNALIEECVERLYMMDLADEEKKYIKEGILLSGLQGKMSDHYWTDAWEILTNRPDDAVNKKDVTTKLKKLYQYLMNLPQYQLC